MEFGFELKRNVRDLKARYVGMVKPINGHSWRQYIKFDNINLCALWAGMNEIAFLQSIQRYYKHLFPNLPKKCPVESGIYSAKNVTLLQDRGDDAPEPTLSTQLPNGIYRHTVRLYDKIDPEGMMLYWHVQIYDSMGEDRF